MLAIQDVEWEACLLEPRRDPEIEKRLKARFGRVMGGVAYFVDCPWLVESIAGLNSLLLSHVHLDSELVDCSGAVVSHENACRYCFAATRAFLRILGHSEAQVRQLEQELLTGDVPAEKRAAYSFARRVSRANPLPAAKDVSALRDAGFSEIEIKELTSIIAVTVFFNRLATLAALPPEGMEQFPDRWYMRLARPLAERVVRRMRRRRKPTYLRDDQRAGPFADVVNELDGLPLAVELRAELDSLFGSEALPRRTKSLVFGVIARGVGCIPSEQEATRLAVEAGLSEAAAARALDHLSAPDSDAIEALALPFARETIWYQPAPIQRRSRELRDAMSRAQYVELLVTISTANMVARLCPALAAAR